MMTATTKCTLVLILNFMVFLTSVATPVPYNGYYVNVVSEDGGGYGFPRYDRVVMLQGSRGFWDFLGNWIQNSNWLPIEVNIPDTFGSITSGISNFTSGIIQRIPFLNNNNGQKPYMLLLPMFRSTTKASAVHKETTEAETETYTTDNKITQMTEENREHEETSVVDNSETSTSIVLESVETTTTSLDTMDQKQIDKILKGDIVLNQEQEKNSHIDFKKYNNNNKIGKEKDKEIWRMLNEDEFWSYF